MDFKKWILQEASLNDLYTSSVEAFPETTKRQHSTDTIKIASMKYTPYLGVKTLYVKGLAQNEGKEYTPMILFRNVKYHPEKNNKAFSLRAEGKVYYLESLSASKNDVLVRCNCPDFQWRFQHFNSKEKSLYGSDRKPYEAVFRPGTANPEESPGMCKHVMKLMKALDASELLQ